MRERDWELERIDEEELDWENDEEFIPFTKNVATEFRCSDCTFIFVKKSWDSDWCPPCPCCSSAHVNRQSSWYEPD